MLEYNDIITNISGEYKKLKEEAMEQFLLSLTVPKKSYYTTVYEKYTSK